MIVEDVHIAIERVQIQKLRRHSYFSCLALRGVTFISKVKTRVRLRCEAEAVRLLNVLVIPQR
jgi:hypothetical protein